ncbi:MAG: hypothetical protein WEB09_01865 [Nitriliruptor sp.]
MEGSAAVEGPNERWWPAIRRIDVIGVVLVLAFAAWAAWVARVTDTDGAHVVWLLLALLITAAAARWATFLHGTAAPALIVVAVLVYAIATADGSPRELGDAGSRAAAGALLAIGTGAAALVVVRLRTWWPRAIFAIIAAGLAGLTWKTGSTGASFIALGALLVMVVLLGFPMRERRWVVVWPGLVAVLALLGTVAFAALGLPEGLRGPDPERVGGWWAALDIVSESPWYGAGPGATDTVAAGSGIEHEPLRIAAETGYIGALLLLAILWWALAWVARPGGGPGSVVAGFVLAAAIAHACFAAIWQVPAVPLALAALAGTASLRGGDAAWRLHALWDRVTGDPSPVEEAPTGGS